jgi:hypothetical protein
MASVWPASEIKKRQLSIIHTCKCHKETPCVVILNKNGFFFFSSQKQEGKTSPGLEVGTTGKGEDIRKGCGK